MEVASLASKRRVLTEGVVVAEVDAEEKSGCLVEIRSRNAETLKSPDFRAFMKDLCQHILQRSPRYISRADVPWEAVRSEERSHRASAERMYATSDRVDDYLTEKMSAWYQEICLMEQPFLKDPSKVVGQVWETVQHDLDDPVELKRFSCYVVDPKG